MIACTCWYIRNARNAVIFDHKSLDLEIIQVKKALLDCISCKNVRELDHDWVDERQSV